MRTRVLTLATAICLATFVGGCKEEDTSSGDFGGGTTAGTVSITASESTVVADGVRTVTLSVTNTTGSPATVTTDRGTFPGGATQATVTGTVGTLVLTTCDAAVAGCAGTAHVNVVAGTAVDSVTIVFGSLATLCSADCNVDPACAGLTCVGTSGAGTCAATTPSSCVVPGGGGGGGGTTPGTGIAVTTARTRMPPDGASATDVVVTVTDDSGAPVAGASVTLSTTAGTLSATTGTTGADGTAKFTLTAPTTAVVATLTASTTVAPIATATATVTFPRLGVLHLTEASVQYPVQGVVGSGWRESGWLQVQALDDQGNPYPDGLAVRFEHQRYGGSTLVNPGPDTATCVAAAGCVGYQAATTSGSGDPDSAGLASAWIRSGTVAGTLATTATATIAGVTRTISLPTVAVVGAKASGGAFSVLCSPRNVPALSDSDCSISLVDAPFTCVATLKDRFGNLLGRSTQVLFDSEASARGQIATTPAYDPASAPTSQTGLGEAVQIFRTLGAYLPLDVAAQPGEPSAVHGLDGCGLRTHNPRDGVVTVTATADGEEAFFDANGNGSYDAGEPFVDQGEPFVDANDDGVWNPGEAFIDVDGSLGYTPRNGSWDANTKIWTQTVVVFTATPAELTVAGGNLLGTRWSATPVQACTATAPDPGFAVLAKVTGPPEVPPTTDTHYFYSSDWNLNRLHAETSYAVEVDVGSIDVRYYGLPEYWDDWGFGYTYRPCDQTGVCAAQCRSTGAALPCVMTPSVGSFGCGIGAAVTITGGDTADPAGASVRFDLTVPYSVYGSDRDHLHSDWLFGSND